MLVKYIVSIAILLGLVSLYWILHGLLLFPVKTGENTEMCINLEVSGESRDLEHTLKGLIWLRDNGTLKADINVMLIEPDNNTRLVANAFSKDYSFISYSEIGE